MFAVHMFRKQPTRSPSQRPAAGCASLAPAVAGVALLLGLLLIPAMSVGAQSAFPANTVVSTYFDARYGEVSVVTDASGNLIDINAATGQRIYPAFADYTSAYPSAYVAPGNTNAYIAPTFVNAATDGYATLPAVNGSPLSLFNSSPVVRQYSDNNSNCADSQVTQTTSGYYCTATGTPAFTVG